MIKLNHQRVRCLCACSVTVVSDSSATTWTVVHQAPSVHGISQARILEWVAISFSRGYSQPREQLSVFENIDPSVRAAYTGFRACNCNLYTNLLPYFILFSFPHFPSTSVLLLYLTCIYFTLC